MKREPRPSRQPYEIMRFTFGEFELDELYHRDDSHAQHYFAIARAKIFRAFRTPNEKRQPQSRLEESRFSHLPGINLPAQPIMTSDSYIIGLSHKRCELTNYLTSQIDDHFVRPKDLPSTLHHIPQRLKQKAAAHIEWKFVDDELESMIDQSQIIYDPALGIWSLLTVSSLAIVQESDVFA